jgi:hypothetical protein
LVKAYGDTVIKNITRVKDQLKTIVKHKSKLTVEKIHIIHTHFAALPEPILKQSKGVETYEKYIHNNLPTLNK